MVNLMSYFGLHRSMRGAAIGHFAATEITSSPGSRRLAEALERMGAPQPCIAFYREHVEADAVHEQVVRTDVVGEMVASEPHLEADIVFGMRALRRGGEPVRRPRDDELEGGPQLAKPAAELTPSRGDAADDWCRTTDRSCCAGTCRSRP